MPIDINNRLIYATRREKRTRHKAVNDQPHIPPCEDII